MSGGSAADHRTATGRPRERDTLWVMALLLLLLVWSLLMVGIVAVCRAGHLEDVARGFAED